jgi:hypothetical protein
METCFIIIGIQMSGGGYAVLTYHIRVLEVFHHFERKGNLSTQLQISLLSTA